MSINHAQGAEPRLAAPQRTEERRRLRKGYIIVLAGPLAKDCPESCQATRISGWRIVGWERHPYLTINYEIGLPVLSPAHQHISGDGIEMWLHAHVSK